MQSPMSKKKKKKNHQARVRWEETNRIEGRGKALQGRTNDEIVKKVASNKRTGSVRDRSRPLKRHGGLGGVGWCARVGVV